MIKRIRPYLLVFGLLILVPIFGRASIVQEQTFIPVTIIINVTPAPIGLRSQPSVRASQQIIAKASLHGAPASLERSFEAQSLHFVPAGQVIAQSQKAVKVEAEVSPNPKGTLLFSDQNAVTVNATAGTTAFVTCAYHVTVDTTHANWQLDHGVDTDVSGSNNATFPGGDIANNTYRATPLPTATPFVVFADDGGRWALIGTGSGSATFCVDLTVNVPVTTPQGAYSTNAVYSLFF